MGFIDALAGCSRSGGPRDGRVANNLLWALSQEE